MSRIILLIAIGGAISSVARYLMTNYFTKLFPVVFPYGTFIVNIVGCLLIGIFYALSERFNISQEWRVFLTTGLCGGFTTFSAFAYENVKLLQDEQYFTFTAYSIASFAFGLIAVVLGAYSIKVIAS